MEYTLKALVAGYPGLIPGRRSEERRRIRCAEEESVLKNPRRNYCLRVRAAAAVFNCPGPEQNHVYYELIPPATVRAIFSAVFWKPAIRWHVTEIEVLSPIRTFNSFRAGSDDSDSGSGCRMEKHLAEVAYRLHADLEYLPPEARINEKCSEPDSPETEMKYFAMFERMAAAGRFFSRPYLGRRDYETEWEYIPHRQLSDERIRKPPLDTTYDRDFGLAFYDFDYSGSPHNPRPLFYHPRMVNGVVKVPDYDSPEIIRFTA